MDQNPCDKNPIDDFKSWALKLGCPVNALPSDAALIRFMKSNHGNVQKLMDQFRPKAEVKLIKDNLLLHSLSNSTNVLSDRHQSDLPDSFRNVKKLEKLNRQIGILRPRVEQLKGQVKDKQLHLSKKADQLTKMKKTSHDNQTKRIQLEQKHNQLIGKISEEKKFEAMLKDSMPVPITADMNEKVEADKAIKKSIQLLSNAYDEVGDREFTKAHRDKVAQDVQKIMSRIPIVTLFDAIRCYSDNEMKTVDYKLTAATHPSSNACAFGIAVAKSRRKIYIDHLKTRKLKEEHASHVEQYVQLYDEYLARIIDAMKSFNGPNVQFVAESICGDYLRHYGTAMCNQAMLQFHQQKLTDLQRLATERNNLLKGSELVTSELTALYTQIEKTYNLALDDIVSLGDVNKNIKQLQSLSKYTINSYGNRSIWNTSTSMLNCTLGSVAPSITVNLAPAEYLNELTILVNIAPEQWNTLPLLLSMDIQSNHSNGTISLFDSILTPHNALKELSSKWTWYKVIDALMQPLDVDKVVPQFTDAELVSTNLQAETVKMAQLMDDIKYMYQTGSKTVSEIQKYLAFLLDTSLGSFIPDRVTLNRRNFRDYEGEFLCACSMISNLKKKK